MLNIGKGIVVFRIGNFIAFIGPVLILDENLVRHLVALDLHLYGKIIVLESAQGRVGYNERVGGRFLIFSAIMHNTLSWFNKKILFNRKEDQEEKNRNQGKTGELLGLVERNGLYKRKRLQRFNLGIDGGRQKVIAFIIALFQLLL